MGQRKVFDQFAKRVMTEMMRPFGEVRREVEVVAEAQAADLTFLASLKVAPPRSRPGPLDLLITNSCLLEAFHEAPSEDEVLACLVKFLLWKRSAAVREGNHGADAALWLLCAGRPTTAIQRFGLQALANGPTGIYTLPQAPALRLGIFVLAELPKNRSTLLLRLLGAGAILREAIAELMALPANAPERQLALPILIELRFDVPPDANARTPEEEEFVMTTQELFEQFQAKMRQEGRQEGHQEGRQEGRQEGWQAGLQQGLQEGARAGLREAIQAICDVLAISLTAARVAELDRMDQPALIALLTRLRTERCWE